MEEIEDKARRQSALALVAQLTRAYEDYDEFLWSSMERYLELVQDFDAGASQILEQAIRPAGEKRRATLLASIDLRSRMRELLTKKEWTAVFGKQDKD